MPFLWLRYSVPVGKLQVSCKDIERFRVKQAVLVVLLMAKGQYHILKVNNLFLLAILHSTQQNSVSVFQHC